MPRVLLVASVLSHIAQFHTPLIVALQADGVEVDVYARDNLDEKPGLLRPKVNRFIPSTLTRSPWSWGNWKAARELRTLLRDDAYDIVHCNTPAASAIVRLACLGIKRQGPKVLYTAHGFHFYKGGPLWNWFTYYPLEVFLSALTDVVITITREDERIARKTFFSRVVRIPGVGIDMDKYPLRSEVDTRFREHLGYEVSDLVLINIGELNANKNQEWLIQSLAPLMERVSSLKLMIVGDGPRRAQLEEQVASAGLASQVNFLGYRRDVASLLGSADALVTASLREGLPLNVMEAMSTGVPVLASRNRGHQELIIDGQTGRLYDLANVSAFRELVRTLRTHESHWCAMCKNARSAVAAYSREKSVELLIDLYRECLGQ